MRFAIALVSVVLSAGALHSQDLVRLAPATEILNPIVELSVPAGTPIKIAIDEEIKVQKVGQRVHGKVMEPIYAFDTLVIPIGSEAVGTISQIDGVPKKIRAWSLLDANFSPPHAVHIAFQELVLPDARHLSIDTVVTPASNGVLQFVAARSGAGEQRNFASQKAAETREQVRRQWESGMKQLHSPGKMHRLKRLAEAELPLHGQYLETRTSFDAVLQQSLDFGIEKRKAESLAKISTLRPEDAVVHARLATALTSANAKKGDPVEAITTEPLSVAGHLLLPAGARIRGAVVEAHPARLFKHNGQLRILFHEVEMPNGREQKVDSSIEAIMAARSGNFALDPEGGAQAQTPRTRYLSTGVQVALVFSALGDHDEAPGRSDIGNASTNGASGFRLVGAILNAAARSRVLACGFGFYGTTMGIYSRFFSRGNEVIYPQHMSMVIGLSMR